MKEDGTFESIEEQVMRVDEAACHPILVTLWEEHGMHLLGEMFDIDEDEGSDIHAKQAKRKQGFGAFLRQLRESRESMIGFEFCRGKGIPSHRLCHLQTGLSGIHLDLGFHLRFLLLRSRRVFFKQWVGLGW